MKKLIIFIVVFLILIMIYRGCLYNVNHILFGYNVAEIKIIENIGLIMDEKQLNEISKDKYTEVKFSIVNGTFENQSLTIITKNDRHTFEMNLPLYAYIAKFRDMNFLIGLKDETDELNGIINETSFKVGDTINIKYKGSIQ